MEPSGPASLSSIVSKGDQICELKPVILDTSEDSDDATASNVVPLIGASFDTVMRAFASLDASVRDVDLVFFKGTKEELKKLCQSTSSSSSSSNSNPDGLIKITVVQNKGSKDESTRIIMAKEGVNIRQTLVDNGINVYQSITRWTNCKGKQLCGTCIVNIKEGSENTNRKSMDEESTLRENPDSYRLSCVTFAYGDVTVETFPPIQASQWTR
jgi:ferredoxin